MVAKLKTLLFAGAVALAPVLAFAQTTTVQTPAPQPTMTAPVAPAAMAKTDTAIKTDAAVKPVTKPDAHVDSKKVDSKLEPVAAKPATPAPAAPTPKS
jgi:hypothetical protein